MDWGLISSHLPPQGPRAEAMMHSAMEQGKWVFFQNCHLAPSWMPSLERLIEGINPNKVTPTPWLRKTLVPTPHNRVALLPSKQVSVPPWDLLLQLHYFAGSPVPPALRTKGNNLTVWPLEQGDMTFVSPLSQRTAALPLLWPFAEVSSLWALWCHTQPWVSSNQRLALSCFTKELPL